MSRTKEQAAAMRECKIKRCYKKALEIIEASDNVVFVQDLSQALGIDRRTFTRYFPVGSDMYEEIMTKMEHNKTSMKQIIREKLLESKNATALIALYRLLGTVEENNKLLLKEQEDAEENKKDKTITLKIN